MKFTSLWFQTEPGSKAKQALMTAFSPFKSFAGGMERGGLADAMLGWVDCSALEDKPGYGLAILRELYFPDVEHPVQVMLHVRQVTLVFGDSNNLICLSRPRRGSECFMVTVTFGKDSGSEGPAREILLAARRRGICFSGRLSTGDRVSDKEIDRYLVTFLEERIAHLREKIEMGHGVWVVQLERAENDLRAISARSDLFN